MPDQLFTFPASCSGGLLNNVDPLTQGSQMPGSAYRMINYEPSLHGGYRRISGYANSYDTLTGATSTPVLGLHVSPDIQQGIFGAKKPASGSNYLHWYNHYYTVAVTNGTGTNLSVGETLTGVVSSADNTAVAATGTIISTASNSIVVNFGKLPSALFATSNVITGGTSTASTTVTGTPVVIGWTAVVSSFVDNDPDGVCASQSPGGSGNLTINGALADSGSVNFTTAASQQPRKITFTGTGNESGRTFTITGTNFLGISQTEAVAGPNNSTVSSTKFFNTITQIATDGATASAITVGSGVGQYRPSAPTMTGVSQIRFETFNWGGPKFTLVDGINPAAVYDGTNYIQITDSNAPTDPTLVAAFSNHLFLAGDVSQPYSLYFSAPVAETDFTPDSGGGVINVGFKIVQIKAFRDQLFIFGTNNIKKLVGNNSANFVLQNVTSNLGCIAPDSVVEFNGEIIFLAPDGIRPVSGTDKIGDIELATLSKPIQSIFEDYIANEDLATIRTIVIKKKSQFRLFFADQNSLGIIGAIRRSGQGNTGFEFGQLVGIEVSCGDSGYIGDEEFVIHGDSLGRVFRQETGNNFNSNDIFSLYQTPFVYMDDPEIRKTMYSINTYLRAEGVLEVVMGLEYDYGDTNVLLPTDFNFTTTGAAAYYDKAKYDADEIYDGNPSPIRSTDISGSGKSVAITYVTNADQPSHTVQAYTITYGLGDRR
tara:strand:+ start:11153 stop:13285 length:2133 start_codon:yes stop_codon:yes gene_type:complete